MAKVKYFVKENKKKRPHSFYAVPVPNGTLTFDELCEEACRNTTIEPSLMKAVVAEYMNVVQANVLKGFRVPIGEQFITIYPSLTASAKDTRDAKGNTEVATAEMVSPRKGKSRLGATISPKFSKKFADSVSWQRVDERTGREIEDNEKGTAD